MSDSCEGSPACHFAALKDTALLATQQYIKHACETLFAYLVQEHNAHCCQPRCCQSSAHKANNALSPVPLGGVRVAQVFNLGFMTHTGTVAAADEWGEPVQRMPVNPSIPGSMALVSGLQLIVLIVRLRLLICPLSIVGMQRGAVHP